MNVPTTGAQQGSLPITAGTIQRIRELLRPDFLSFRRTLVEFPIGGIVDFAGVGPPPGAGQYLKADGSSQLRSAYLELFNAIGTVHGSVDANHFNLPNFTGAMAMGDSGTHALGSTGGADAVTLTAAQSGVPAHTHPTTVTFSTGAGGTTTGNAQPPNNNVSAGPQPGNATSANAPADAAAAHGNLPPFVAITKWIRYA